MRFETGQYLVKLAETQAEVHAALALRHSVFVAEYGAQARTDGLDRDEFDPGADHLILMEKADNNRVIAASRLISGRTKAGFYSAGEFDLAPLLHSGKTLAEIGRTCVAADHRNGIALHLMWSALAEYVLRRDIDLVFGVASFPGLDPTLIAEALSYLQANHLAPASLRPVAQGVNALPVKATKSTDRIKALSQMPPLLRFYLRLGCQFGQDAWSDPAFNCIDVLVILDRAKLDARYRGFLGRGLTA